MLRYFVLQAARFDALTPLDPTILAPKTANGFGATPAMPVPSQNEPRLSATVAGLLGRFSWRSLLRGAGGVGTDPPGGNIAALVRVRCVTPPSPGDYLEQRSASASEQVAPPGMDQALTPQIPLTQQWSAPMVFDPTDALAVRHISANEGPAQIVIEVAEFSGELYNLWVTQQGCCDCAGEIDCCGEETRDVSITELDIGGVQLAPSAKSLTVNVTSEIPGGIVLLPLVGISIPGARIFVRRAPGSQWFRVAAAAGINGFVAPDGILLDSDGEGVYFELTNGSGYTGNKAHRDLEPVPVTVSIAPWSGTAVRAIQISQDGNVMLPPAETVAEGQDIILTKERDGQGGNAEAVLIPFTGEAIDSEVNKNIVSTNVGDTVVLTRDGATPPGWRSRDNLFGRVSRIVDTANVPVFVIGVAYRGVVAFRSNTGGQSISLPLSAVAPIGYTARIFSTHALGGSVAAPDGTLIGLGASGAAVALAQYVVRQFVYEGNGVWTVT